MVNQPDDPIDREDEHHYSSAVFCDCYRCEVPWDDDESVPVTSPPLTARLIDIARFR